MFISGWVTNEHCQSLYLEFNTQAHLDLTKICKICVSSMFDLGATCSIWCAETQRGPHQCQGSVLGAVGGGG